MSVYETSHRAPHFTGLFGALVSSVVAWNDARVTRSALSRLSDRELDDIGLSRGDIDSIAERF